MHDLSAAWTQIAAEAALLSQRSTFPIWTDAGQWVSVDIDVDQRGVLPHHGSWMVGDLPAILWFLASGAPTTADRPGWRTQAQIWSSRLANRTHTRSFASVSHLFFRGVFIGMAVSDEPELAPLARTAAETISERFTQIGYMKSFGVPEDSIYPFTTVDDVINLVIPLWLARQTGDTDLYERAVAAIDQIAEELVRPDGSTGQVLLMRDARPDGVDTYQGLNPEGCWSRGQAWGIYGFATAYAMTGEARHLQVARDMAAYWIEHVQDDPSPVWDFAVSDRTVAPRDSFAAALALAGILELACSVPPADAARLRDYAGTMVAGLSARYVEDRPRGLGLVADAALDVPHGHGVGASVIVGDSYFTEAVWRLTNPAALTSGSVLPR